MIKKALPVVGMLFVLYVIYSSFISPRIESINDQAGSYESAVNAIDLRISSASGINQEEVLGEIEDVATQLPPQAAQRDIIDELVPVFSGNGVEWVGASANATAEQSLIQFDATDVSRGGLVEVELSFEVEGSVDEIRNSLEAMRGLDRRYTVTSVSLSFIAAAQAAVSPTGDAIVSAPPDLVRAEISASVWVWRPSDPTELPDPAPTPVDEASNDE